MPATKKKATNKTASKTAIKPIKSKNTGRMKQAPEHMPRLELAPFNADVALETEFFPQEFIPKSQDEEGGWFNFNTGDKPKEALARQSLLDLRAMNPAGKFRLVRVTRILRTEEIA